ncbi:MAG: HlyD family efflux transporter periplasmic adaptor subunit [Cyanobacteria bacterium J06597_1]
MDAITLAWTEAGQRKTQTFVDTYSTKNPGTIRVGRDPAQCDVVLPSLSASDRTVSRLHVEIAFNPTHSSFYLRNLKPQNPVQVDGSAVAEEAVLQEGSVIRLGKVEVEVAAVAAVPATIFISASERPTLVYKPAEDLDLEAERSAQRQELQGHRVRSTSEEHNNSTSDLEPPTEFELPVDRKSIDASPAASQANPVPENLDSSSPVSNTPVPSRSVSSTPDFARSHGASITDDRQSVDATANGRAVTGEPSHAARGAVPQLGDRSQDILNSFPKPSLSLQSLFKPVPLAIGAAVLAAVGVLQWQRLNTITSTQAFVNSRVVAIEAPVSGELRLQNINSGQLVREGVLLGNIYDPRNIELQRTQQSLKNEIENLIYRQQQLQVQLDDRRNSFQRIEDEANAQQSAQQGSVEFLEAELEDAISAARDAQLDLAQVRELEEEGAVTEQEVVLAEAARASAEDVVNQLREQLDAARQGSASDQQSSSVTAVVENRRAALQREITNFEQVLLNLQTETDQKQQQLDSIIERLSRQTPANIISPADGEIWTVDYQPGLSNTVVVSGDRIAELAQCEGLWVEALVSSRDATHITEGSDARIFIPNGFRRQRLDGVVREIRTASDPISINSDDIAISPDELGPGEVAAIVDLKSPENSNDFCNIGRTTEVRFSRR